MVVRYFRKNQNDLLKFEGVVAGLAEKHGSRSLPVLLEKRTPNGMTALGCKIRWDAQYRLFTVLGTSIDEVIMWGTAADIIKWIRIQRQVVGVRIVCAGVLSAVAKHRRKGVPRPARSD